MPESGIDTLTPVPGLLVSLADGVLSVTIDRPDSLNSLSPPVAAGALKALEIAIAADDSRALLQEHARRFRAGLEAAGFKTLPGVTPIIPVMLGEARLAQDLARALDERGVYVAGFFFPVVPKGAARIRTQMSAALTAEDVDAAVAAFGEAGRALGIV